MTRRLVVALLQLVAVPLGAQERPRPEVEETTVALLEAAFRDGSLTCHALVDAYLRRITAYDKNGPALNAIVTVNPDALATADSLDRRFRTEGPVGPLHCVPMIVKENFETIGLPSTAGSLSLQGFVSDRDAFQVARIKAAGAIVLAKSNMAEFAFSPYETVSSILPGYTRNPYSLDRVTAGSSGGTAAAVAASFGTAGLGTDTGNSIRGPSSHQALVGIRSTMGLTSRAGIVPLSLAADIAGPMARTVADAVAVFQVIVGEDPADPATRAARGPPAGRLRRRPGPDGLEGARIGVLHRPTTRRPPIPRFERSSRRRSTTSGGRVPRSSIPWRSTVSTPGVEPRAGSCFPFKHDLNAWLAGHGDRVPVKTLAEVIASRRFHPSIEARLRSAEAVTVEPEDDPDCASRDRFRARLRQGVLDLMAKHRLDALVYPTWSNPPRLIGDLNTPAGDNNQLFSPSTGFPAITVPMGYTRGGRLPAGLQFFGRPWTESVLIRLAYAYEQATHHRRPPTATPPLN